MLSEVCNKDLDYTEMHIAFKSNLYLYLPFFSVHLASASIILSGL